MWTKKNDFSPLYCNSNEINTTECWECSKTFDEHSSSSSETMVVFSYFIWMYFFNGMKFTKENKSKRMKKMKISIASKMLQQLIMRMWCFSFKFNGSISLIHLCQMQFKWNQRAKLHFTFFSKKNEAYSSFIYITYDSNATQCWWITWDSIDSIES